MRRSASNIRIQRHGGRTHPAAGSGPTAGGSVPAPAGLWAALTGRLHRRGNAMIMAVSLTVLLAIIGSSFVIMSRMDRQAVRGVTEQQALEAAKAATLAQILRVLADDLVDNISPLTPATLNSLLDNNGGTPPPNSLISREPYDYPGSADPWLAPIEPDNATGTIQWQQTSEIWGDVPGPLAATLAPAGASNGGPADADGDGIADSHWRLPAELNTDPNRQVFVAVRIIDNSGLLNVNSALGMTQARPMTATDPYLLEQEEDSFGEYLSQVNIDRLLNRFNRPGVMPQVSLDTARKSFIDWRFYGQPYINAGVLPNLTPFFYYHDQLMRNYETVVANGYSYRDSSGPFSFFYRPFPVGDELELRNRYCINSNGLAWLEQPDVLGQVLAQTDPANPAARHRMLPFSAMDAVGNRSAVDKWYAYLTGDGAITGEWTSQRHLLTTFSADREIRIHQNGAVTGHPDVHLDNHTTGGVGKFRKVNVNQVLRDWANRGVSPASAARANASILRMGRAVQAALLSKQYAAGTAPLEGVTLASGLQYVANLIDYLDADSEPTVFDVTALAAGEPGPPFVAGNERQPFIVEVMNAYETAPGLPSDAGIALFNPYDTPIEMTAWEVYYGSGPTPAKAVINGIVPAGGILALTIKGGTLPLQDSAGTPMTGFSLNGEGLLLVRPVPVGSVNVGVVLDLVSGADMARLDHTTPATAPETRNMWRGLSTIPGMTPWSWTRNVFSNVSTAVGAAHMTVMDKVTNAADMLNVVGVSMPIVNRGLAPVGGWQELGRVLFVGNPIYDETTGLPVLAARTITQRVKDLTESFVDDGDGLWTTEPVEADKDRNGNYPQFDPGFILEGELRFSFSPSEPFDDTADDNSADRNGVFSSGIEGHMNLFNDPAGLAFNANYDPRGRELMNRLSLVSRADDGLDNNNDDGDYRWDTFYEDATTSPGTLNPGLATAADDLLETRVQGRLNVNTMPRAVFETIIPQVRYLNPAHSAYQAADAELFITSLAQDFVRRQRAGPIGSVCDLLSSIDSFSDPSAGGQATYRLRKWREYRNSTAFEPLGDPSLTDDFEERDWLFLRMANLLTVRSDTFTAYILIRVQNAQNPAEYAEQRVVALLDRSNLFLPEAAARNGLPLTGTPPYADDSGDLAVMDPTGSIFGPAAAGMLDDPDYFDRRYTTPKVVALRVVPDVK